MSSPRLTPWALSLFVLAMAFPAVAQQAVVPDDAASATLTASDEASAAPASVPGAAASSRGVLVWQQSQRSATPEAHGLTRLTQRLGDPRVLGRALLASYVTGRLTGLPDITASSARVAGATFGALALCAGVGATVGRSRPVAAPQDVVDFPPLGRLDRSFPSVRASLAFATAAAVDGETRAGWVPWVAYPVAAAVGLSGAHEDPGWLGDVAAGAALGFWTGRAVDRFERTRMRGLFERATFLTSGSRRNFRVGFRTRF